jgi:aminopeptidase N
MKARRLPQWTTTLALLLSLSICNAAADQATAPRQLPPARVSRITGIDVTHVAIALRLDWKSKQAYGISEISLTPTAATREIMLDGAFLTINSVALTDGTSLKYNYDGSARDGALVIALDRAYGPGEPLTLKIDYRTNWRNRSDPNNIWGSFGKGLRFFEPSTTVPTKRRQVWSMGEPESNRYWFPGIDAPNDVRTTDITVTVEKPLTAISNGILVESTDNPDGTRSFRWRMATPYPNHLTSFVVGEYVDIEQRARGVALHTLAYPDERAAAIATVVRLPEMLGYFSDLTGRRYPWARYSQVMVQDFPGGMANAMASTVTDNMIDDFRTHADFYYLWDLQESQVLAGQWFGALISPKDWQDIWLSHSFAHYLDESFNEQRNGRAEFLLYQLLTDQATYLGDWRSGIRHPVVTPHYDSVDSFVADNYSIFRGALVLHMLRKHLGEKTWNRVIKRYVAANSGKQVSTADFQRAVEAEAREPMDWFFDQWLYKMGHPVFNVSKRYDAAARLLTLNVVQTQKVDPDDPYPQTAYFKGKLAVEIDGRTETILIEPRAEQSFSFKSARAPKLVHFDFESTWIKEITFDKSLDELLYQFERDRDVTGRNAAMQALVLLAKNDRTLSADKERIYAAFRRVISSEVYWRLRGTALAQLRGLLAPGPAAAELDKSTLEMLRRIARRDTPWLRAGALRFLGMTRDPAHASLYLAALGDSSDRVINAAATALGQSGSRNAFDALVKLIPKPSWKSQSLISALNGFKELGDQRSVPIAMEALADTKLPRWWLATPVWDHRLAAADTLVALGRASDAFPMIFNRFKAAIHEDDDNDIFGNLQLLATLGDPRGREAIAMLKQRYKDDTNAMTAVAQYETQLEAAIKPRPR